MKKIFFIICMSYCSLGWAQISVPKEKVDSLQSGFLKANFTPLGNAALSNIVSNVALSSTLNEGENGKIELKYNFKNWWTGGLSVDQKIGEGDKKAEFYDFTNGISPGTTIGFNLQKIFWSPKLSGSGFEQFDALATAYAKNKGVERRTVTYNDIAQNGTADEKESLSKLKLKFPVFFNLKISFTKSNFSFTTDSVNLKGTEANYFTPNLGLSIGIPFSLKSYLAISYSYSESYQDADALTFSSPFGSTKNTFSQTLVFGAPQRKLDNKVSLELRESFGKNSDFAIDPTFTYAFNSDKMAISIPLYFIQGATKVGKPNGLQGGISLGYLTKTSSLSSFKDGFGAQLILTTPFDVFGSLK
ncbi:MAG: hypothetical protein JWR09_4241 [Mucilaginibacter sp.]|nr:hypothetical protein [Mucilaginibacter sp.]